MASDAIPPQALVQHVAVLGKTGSGKTSTAKIAVEQVVAGGGRVCVLDPIKSDWWGLTSSADGKKPGLEFSILGGPHGHVPLPSSSGKAIGELVAGGALPLSIIDMAEFEAGGLQRFFVDFAAALLRGMCGVLYLVIEEAHEFAPKERSGIGAENMAIHWAKKIATAGRSKGIRLILATQRTQSLHNALLTSCETIIVHRTTSPADQKPVLDWLKANTSKAVLEQVAGSLASLKTGTGWICSGEAGIFERREFPGIQTFDNSATPTRDSTRQEVKTAAVDRERLRSIIGVAVEEAEANNPGKLKAEVVRLRSELEKAGRLSVEKSNEFEDGLREEQGAKLRDLQEQNAGLHAILDGAAMAIENALTMIRAKPAPLPESEPRPRGQGIPPSVRAKIARTATAPAASSNASTPPAGVSVPQVRVLASLGFWKSIGQDAPTREQIAAVAGYSPGSGGFGNLVGSLRTAGFIEIPQPGHASLSADVPFEGLTGAQAAGKMLAVLSAPERKLVDAALDEAGELTRDELATATGYSAGSGGFGNLIGALCTIGIFTKPRPGAVALSEWARELLERGGH